MNEFKIERIASGVIAAQIATDDDPYIRVDFFKNLHTLVEKIKQDQTVSVVILKGGDKYFCAGASENDLTVAERRDFIIDHVNDIPRQILSIPVPTIAVMSGHAIGGGWMMGLWSDMVVMAEESLYGANYMSLGFTPGVGATAILREVFNATYANELLFTGRLLKGREIKDAGFLIPAIVPQEQAWEHALNLANEIALNTRASLHVLKQTIAARRLNLAKMATQSEREMHGIVFADSGISEEIHARYSWSANKS